MDGSAQPAMVRVLLLTSYVCSQPSSPVLCQKISKSPATNLDNFWLLVLICNVSTLVPLVLIGWIPAGDPGSLKKPVVAGLSRGEDEDLRRLP